jgi:hypothetical protein
MPKNLKKKSSSKKVGGFAMLLANIKESMDHLGVMDKVTQVLHEIEERAGDVKQEANKELKNLYKRHEGTYKSIEKKIMKVSNEAKEKAQVSMINLLQKWHENKEKLPKALTKEIENIVGQVGIKAMKIRPTMAKKASIKAKAQKATKKPTARKTKTKTTTHEEKV